MTAASSYDTPSTALHAALRASAAGIYPIEAGTGLLISHDTWLLRDDFTAAFVHTRTSITDGTTTMAEVDWPEAISALDAGTLPCSGGEQRMLRLAASLAGGIPVSLRDTLTRHRRPQHRPSDHCDLPCLGTTAITRDSLIIS
ncbi:MAG: hypothetical protein M3Z75_29610 [Actinomycetota bacterium]|nr:hypothetical protein [Actinomycetota bacterium]